MIQLVPSRISDDVPVVKKPDSPEMRAALFWLEAEIQKMDQVELEYIHRFTPGLYTREMIVPEGVILTGAIYKTEHISIFLEGRMLVPSEGGSVEIEAPLVEIAKPGVKRVGLALEKVRWLTVHPTDETDVEQLEDMLWTNDPKDVQHLIDQQDYESLGISSETIDRLMEIDVHAGDVDGVQIGPSIRHGNGLFAIRDFMEGESIAPAVLDGKLMVYSRYTNHSAEPNACIEVRDSDVWIVATRNISGEEITIDYRTTHRTDKEMVDILDQYKRKLECQQQ